MCLCERVLQYLVAQSVHLDIHLACGQSVAGTRGLEVHVSEVVLIAEDVAQDGVFRTFALGDKSHSDTADGFLDGHTGVHKGERAGTYGRHRR